MEPDMQGLAAWFADPANESAKQGLLSFGLNLMASRGKFGPALGQAGLAGMNTYAQHMQNAKTNKLRDLQFGMAQTQFQNEQDDRKASVERARAMTGLRQKYAQPARGDGSAVTFPGNSASNASGAQPAQPVGNSDGFDYQGYANELAQYDPETALKIRDQVRPKVKDYKEVRDANGVTIVGFTEDGRPIRTGLTPFKAPEVRDFGGYIGGIDPIAGGVQRYGDKTMSAAERDSSARGWANVRAQDDANKAARDAAKGAPPGFRWTPSGALQAIPGGPADLKANAEGERRSNAASAGIEQANRVIAKVDEAIDGIGGGWTTTGLVGSAVGGVAGTSAYDLRRNVETIKANLGFDALQAMRQASPTGGALGQVAVQELSALQASVANLDANQSEKQLRDNLAQVRARYTRMKELINQGQNGQGGADGSWAPEPARPGLPSVDAIEAELRRRQGR